MQIGPIFPVFATAWLVAFSWAVDSAAADPLRGRSLYETGCHGCHDRSVHNRAARTASSFDEIRAHVARWNKEVRGSWTAEEIDDVTLYLNQTYYSFPCPPRVCKAEQGSSGASEAAWTAGVR